MTWRNLRGELDPHTSLGSGITPATVAAYIGDLVALGNRTSTILCRVQELRDCLRVMVPTLDWHWILDFEAELRDELVPSQNKLSQLQCVDDLFRLGKSLMSEAEAAVHLTAPKRAVRYRDGLAVALLAARPIRIGTFIKLAIGQTLLSGAAGYQIILPKAVTKNRAHLENGVPADLAPNLARYIGHYRAVLLGCGGRYTPADLDALWISREGTAMAEESMRNAIKRWTRNAFGVGVSPHRFRDASATDIADKDPEHVLAAASVLGNHPTTMMKHYNQSRGRAAHARYHAAIAELRGVKPRSSH